MPEPLESRPRPILINNWEATYFNFTEEKILQIAQAAAQLGIELFVLDDGWFGQRDDDHRSLGDWYVNTRKLPHGLKHLAEQIEALGLRFGLWFEPEMISPSSDLYRAHPDWCLHAPGRPRTEGRHQLILDLGRPEVQQFIISMLKETLSSAPISYVKWDMNRNMTEAFSAALPPERQMETQHRYMLGLYHVLEEITKAFPKCCLKAAPEAVAALTPACYIICPKPGPATIPMPSSALAFNTAPRWYIRPVPWAPISAPAPITRLAVSPPCKCAATLPSAVTLALS